MRPARSPIHTSFKTAAADAVVVGVDRQRDAVLYYIALFMIKWNYELAKWAELIVSYHKMSTNIRCRSRNHTHTHTHTHVRHIHIHLCWLRSKGNWCNEIMTRGKCEYPLEECMNIMIGRASCDYVCRRLWCSFPAHSCWCWRLSQVIINIYTHRTSALATHSSSAAKWRDWRIFASSHSPCTQWQWKCQPQQLIKYWTRRKQKSQDQEIH